MPRGKKNQKDFSDYLKNFTSTAAIDAEIVHLVSQNGVLKEQLKDYRAGINDTVKENEAKIDVLLGAKGK